MIVAQPDAQAMMGVLGNLRPQSRAELAMQEIDPEILCRYLAAQDGCRWLVLHSGLPAALIGAYPQHRGVWSLYGFGTDLWEKEWRLVTGVARRNMMRHVADSGAHRAHCMSPASHVQTHRWLRTLGAMHEAEMPGYGARGEDFIMFSWLRGAPCA